MNPINEFTLPGALVLLVGPSADPHDIVFLGLLEAVLRGALTVEGRVEERFELRVTIDGLARPIARLMRVIVDADTRWGMVAVRDEFTRHWVDARHFMTSEVWGFLEDRGLVSTNATDLDGFAVTPFHLTKTGQTCQRKLIDVVATSTARSHGLKIIEASGQRLPDVRVLEVLQYVEDQMTPGDRSFGRTLGH